MSNQTNNKLSIERIEQYANDKRMCNVNDEILEMARRLLSAEAELQEYRKASNEPVGSFHIVDQRVDGTTDYIADGDWPIDNGELVVYAAPPLQAVTVPDGWQLVPKEATKEMLDAAWISHGVYHPSAYRTMLAAAPQPSSNTLQLVSTTEAAPVPDSTAEITMPISPLK